MRKPQPTMMDAPHLMHTSSLKFDNFEVVRVYFWEEGRGCDDSHALMYTRTSIIDERKRSSNPLILFLH